MLIEPVNSEIAIARQCSLVALARSSWYYQPRRDDGYNEHLMRLMDEEYLRHPFYGRRQLTNYLRTQGHPVNPKRVGRLMREMGIVAIYPKRNTSVANSQHKKFPYLLGGLNIWYPNQVWTTDVTYIRMIHGWLYLVAIMDWYSRYVVSWELSNTLDVEFCLAALDRALAGNKPGIFNSDQGANSPAPNFTGRLESSGIRISMDGRGRIYDNIFVERLWRTVKYEEVYIHDYQSVPEARRQLQTYFRFYNQERPHSSLGKKPPAEIYFRPTAH